MAVGKTRETTIKLAENVFAEARRKSSAEKGPTLVEGGPAVEIGLSERSRKREQRIEAKARGLMAQMQERETKKSERSKLRGEPMSPSQRLAETVHIILQNLKRSSIDTSDQKDIA